MDSCDSLAIVRHANGSQCMRHNDVTSVQEELISRLRWKENAETNEKNKNKKEKKKKEEVATVWITKTMETSWSSNFLCILIKNMQSSHKYTRAKFGWKLYRGQACRSKRKSKGNTDQKAENRSIQICSSIDDNCSMDAQKWRRRISGRRIASRGNLISVDPDRSWQATVTLAMEPLNHWKNNQWCQEWTQHAVQGLWQGDCERIWQDCLKSEKHAHHVWEW